MHPQLLNALKDCVEGRMSHTDWRGWWASHAREVEVQCDRFTFLRLKVRGLGEAETILEAHGISAQPRAGYCRRCGEPLFTALPGKTTAAEIRAFAESSKLPGWEEVIRDGWLHPGQYCSNGCTQILWNICQKHKNPCAVCGQAVGTDKQNILDFDSIDVPEPDFQHFRNGLAHVSCLSSWGRRDEFVEAWNRALSEYYIGKQLRLDADGRVAYTDNKTWVIHHSPEVERREAERQMKFEEEARRRKADLSDRMEAARQKAIRLGLASPADVNRILYDMPLDEYRRQFSEFRVSRAFFRNAE